MSCALSFTCAYTYPSLPHPPPLPHHVAMHYWRLGVAVFLPAQRAYIYFLPPPLPHCNIAVAGSASQPAVLHNILPSWTGLQVLSGPGWNGSLCSEARGWTATSAAAGQRKSEEEQSVFCFFFSPPLFCFKGPRRLSVSLPARLHAFPQLAAAPAEPQ